MEIFSFSLLGLNEREIKKCKPNRQPTDRILAFSWRASPDVTTHPSLLYQLRGETISISFGLGWSCEGEDQCIWAPRQICRPNHARAATVHIDNRVHSPFKIKGPETFWSQVENDATCAKPPFSPIIFSWHMTHFTCTHPPTHFACRRVSLQWTPPLLHYCQRILPQNLLICIGNGLIAWTHQCFLLYITCIAPAEALPSSSPLSFPLPTLNSSEEKEFYRKWVLFWFFSSAQWPF